MQSAIFIERPDGIPACARFSDCLPPNQPFERCQWHVGDRLPQLVVVFLGTIMKRWQHKQMAHVLWQQRCLEVASRLHHVGVVDETRRTYRHHGRQRDAPRRIATFHHATLRVAPHRYATREPLGTPGGSRVFSADGHPQAPVAPRRSCAARTFFVAQSWAECITNMPGFNLRQAQAHFRGIIIPSSAGRSKVC